MDFDDSEARYLAFGSRADVMGDEYSIHSEPVSFSLTQILPSHALLER